MANKTIFHEFNATGTIVKEGVMPNNIPEHTYLELLVTGGGEQNIYDIVFTTEVWKEDHWKRQDQCTFARDIDDALIPVSGRMKVLLPNFAGKLVRTTLNCGQSSLSVDATLTWR